MVQVKVKPYIRRDRGKILNVGSYLRRKRPMGKKRKIEKKQVKGLFLIRDEMGMIHGYKSKK